MPDGQVPIYWDTAPIKVQTVEEFILAELKNLKQEIKQLREEFKQLKNEVKKQNLGEWQLCPKCKGQGQIFTSDSIGDTTALKVGWFICDLCNGAKVLAKPKRTAPTFQQHKKKTKTQKQSRKVNRK